MTDTWAAKVLEGVPRHNAQDAKNMTGYAAAVWLHEDAVVDAIAKLAEGGGLVERLRAMDGDSMSIKTLDEAADRIAALTAQLAEKEEQLVSVLRREAATHKRHDERVARLEALNPNRPNELTTVAMQPAADARALYDALKNARVGEAYISDADDGLDCVTLDGIFNLEAKTCPPCHGDCNQGRTCPARRK